MGRLGSRERDCFLAIKDVCSRGLDGAKLLREVGDRLAETIGADATCMVQLDPSTALPVFVVSRGWEQDDFRPFVDHALLATPTADPGRLIERGLRTVAVDELLPAHVPYHRDPYFTHHLLPRGYRHELQTACAAGKRGQALLTVTRRESTGSFEARHWRLLDAVAPHVAAGLHAATVRQWLGAPGAAETGFIVLDGSGKVQLANRAGERWLATPDVPDRPGRLWVLHVLAGLLARSLTGEGASQVPLIEFADPVTGALYRLQAERARGANGDWCTIILLEPVRRVEDLETLLRIGLTPREAEITLATLRGATVDKIAAGTGISPHTVTQHLRNVFSKLGVSSRRDLMQRLSRGA